MVSLVAVLALRFLVVESPVRHCSTRVRQRLRRLRGVVVVVVVVVVVLRTLAAAGVPNADPRVRLLHSTQASGRSALTKESLLPSTALRHFSAARPTRVMADAEPKVAPVGDAAAPAAPVAAAEATSVPEQKKAASKGKKKDKAAAFASGDGPTRPAKVRFYALNHVLREILRPLPSTPSYLTQLDPPPAYLAERIAMFDRLYADAQEQLKGPPVSHPHCVWVGALSHTTTNQRDSFL